MRYIKDLRRGRGINRGKVVSIVFKDSFEHC